MFANNFTSIIELRDRSTRSLVWQFSNSILEGPAENSSSILNTARYYLDIVNGAEAKQNTGFNTSLTDYYGRALLY